MKSRMKTLAVTPNSQSSSTVATTAVSTCARRGRLTASALFNACVRREFLLLRELLRHLHRLRGPCWSLVHRQEAFPSFASAPAIDHLQTHCLQPIQVA